MKILIIFALAIISLQAHSQTISADSAKNYEHKNVKVCGTVTGLKSLPKVSFINFGPGYPNNTFTGVIFADDKSKFPGFDTLAFRAVCITGTVEIYKGKPQIVLRKPEQLEVK